MSYDRVYDWKIQFEPDGGDLGRAFRWVEPLEFSVILPHVAYILESLFRLNNSRLPYVYAFEFHSYSRSGIELVMMSAKLPEHVEWYESDGMKIFGMRGVSGGIVSNNICYLVTKSR